MNATMSDIRFVLLGTAESGQRAATLLCQQGASLEGAAGWEQSTADVLLDARGGADARADLLAWRTQHPRGIVVRLTDFPRAHPSWTGQSLLNNELIHAELGINQLHSANDPQAEPLPIASVYGAVWTAVHVATALFRRDLQGTGCHIELPLFAAALTAQARWLLKPDEPTLTDPVMLPHLPQEEIYECADGRYFQSHGMFEHFAAITATVLGHPEWADDARKALNGLPDRAAQALWRERYATAFKTRPALEWEERIVAAQGCGTMCRNLEEWLVSPNAIATGIVTGDGDLGPAVNVRPSTGVGFPCDPRLRPTEGPWSDVRQQPGDPDASALPLRGLRVVDMCIILAGPTCGRTLAEFGADVIKVDQADRAITPYGWLDVNRGKRSMLLNIKSPEGLTILHRILGGADVVLQNYRHGKMRKLGLDYETLSSTYPSLIHASSNAFDYGGPWEERAGWEHNAQAGTGIQTARAKNGRPRQLGVPAHDYACGLLNAFGVIAAARTRLASGRGACITASLARTATFMQTGSPRDDKPHTSCLIDCLDGTLRVCGNVPPALVKLLAAMPGADALRMTRERGFEAAMERATADLEQADWMDEAGLRISWQHPTLGNLTQVRAVEQAGALPSMFGVPAPDRGQETGSILASLGFSEPEIDGLEARGVVRRRVDTFEQNH